MVDFPARVFMVILTFVMLVIAPLLNVYIRAEMTAERVILNEIVQFIDKTTDKGTIVRNDLDELYVGVNAAGGVYDVKVKRYKKESVPTENPGETRVIYLSQPLYTDNGDVMALGEVVKVTVTEVGVSPTKRLLWSVLRMDSGGKPITLAGSVR